VPTAWLGLMDQVFILALIPIMNGIVYPALDKRGCSVSLVTRIGKYIKVFHYSSLL
jgi:dipeptide/tripeptide permease